MLSMAYDMQTLDHSEQELVGIVSLRPGGLGRVVLPGQLGAARGRAHGHPRGRDFLPAQDDYSLVLLEVAYDKKFKSGGSNWAANSAVAQISVRGELETQHIQACTGSPMNYNQITHEMRVDPRCHAPTGAC